jgi:inhibitor of the pro-sigma K processing machinery
MIGLAALKEVRDLGISLDLNIILAYALGLLLLYILGWLLIIPVKLVVRLIYNGIIGGLMLWVLNLAGSFFDFRVAINPVTALIAGFLGIPGVLLLIVLQYIL